MVVNDCNAFLASGHDPLLTRFVHPQPAACAGTPARFQKVRQTRRYAGPPALELLEPRLTLTGNITITAASVVDANDTPLTKVSAGEWVYISASFTTVGLPSDATYRVGFTVNGLTRDAGSISWGAGASGTQSWTVDWGAFIATPGTNQVTAVVDPDQSVPETTYQDNSMSFTFNAASPAVGNPIFTVAQIRNAYGLNSLPSFGAATADGTGQAIALEEAGNDPNILTDLDGFDQAMSLTTTSTKTIFQQYGPASSFVTVYNQSGANITLYLGDSGSNGVPAQDPTGHWEGEETLDAEWAHAMAPGARIDIIEVNDDSNWGINILNGNILAAGLPSVSVVSNSYGLTEWSGETADDSSIFVTPSGHPGVTFLTASNDNGANVYPSPPTSPPPSVGNDGYYPATSPDVVSVGGTELTLNNDGYGSETGWSYPAPANTVTNGSSSYTQSGSWTAHSGGFSGTYSTAAGGSLSSATWTIAVTPANTGWGTEVSATWTPSATNATNATYTVYDGTPQSGTILGTVVVNQTKAPAGTLDDGAQFQELGVFFPTLNSSGYGTLTVVLNAQSANGTVVADAVGAAQAWASTGGPTPFESEPSYQLPVQTTGFRTTPDVAFDASENSGVITYFDGGLSYGSFGTSLASPCWAGLIAIANQGRMANNTPTLNSPANPLQTLQALYSLPSRDFHDITSGYNGFSAGEAYDLVTGRGSPIGNLLIPALVSYGVPGFPTRPTPNPMPSPGPVLLPISTPPTYAPTQTSTRNASGPASTPPPAAPPRPAPQSSEIQATKTVLTSRPRQATFGRAVVLSVNVTDRGRGAGKPTGQVTFWDGSAMLGAKALESGKATMTTTSLPLGRDTIQVIYGGGPTSSASKATIVENVKEPRNKGRAAASPAARARKRNTPVTARASEARRPTDPTAAATFFAASAAVLGPMTLDPAKPENSTASSSGHRTARIRSQAGATLVAGGIPPRKHSINESVPSGHH